MTTKKFAIAFIALLLTQTTFALTKPRELALLNTNALGKKMQVTYQVCTSFVDPRNGARKCESPITTLLESGTYLAIADPVPAQRSDQQYANLSIVKAVTIQDGKEVAISKENFCGSFFADSVIMLNDYNTNRVICTLGS